jgi:ATP-dependent RNA helicase DeaD
MGYSVEGLHGDINQTQRLNAVQKLKSGIVDFLVATDVAARGLDIENITHVINYNIPEDPESYVHRIGRTGRAGREGTALTLVTAREFRNLKLIEQYTKSRVKRKDIPTIEDVMEQKMEKLKDNIVSVIQEGKFTQLKSIVLGLSEDYDLVDVSAAALKCILDMQQGNSTDAGHDLNVEQKPNYDQNDGDMVRCFINIGRKDKVAPGDIVRAIADACRVPGNAVGRIDIYNEYSFVDISRQHAEKVLDVMDKNTIKGKRINIEKAKAKRK